METEEHGKGLSLMSNTACPQVPGWTSGTTPPGFSISRYSLIRNPLPARLVKIKLTEVYILRFMCSFEWIWHVREIELSWILHKDSLHSSLDCSLGLNKINYIKWFPGASRIQYFVYTVCMQSAPVWTVLFSKTLFPITWNPSAYCSCSLGFHSLSNGFWSITRTRSLLSQPTPFFLHNIQLCND